MWAGSLKATLGVRGDGVIFPRGKIEAGHVWLYWSVSVFPSLPNMSSVTFLSSHEVRIAGQKLLTRGGILYTIRDRESDADYDPDEAWTFEAWCGVEVTDAVTLSVWLHHNANTTSPPFSVTAWISDDCVVSIIMDGGRASIHAIQGASVWAFETSVAEFMDTATSGAFAGSLEDYKQCLEFGLKTCRSFPPRVEHEGEDKVRLYLCVADTDIGSLHHDWVLERLDISEHFAALVRQNLPAKPWVTAVTRELTVSEVPPQCRQRSIPYVPLHRIFGYRPVQRTTWFKGRHDH